MDQIRIELAGLFDTNIILDLLLSRVPWAVEAARLLAAAKAGEIRAFVSASSITDIFYVCRKILGASQARVAIERCLNAFEIIAVDEGLLRQALSLPIDDLEDALQVACAARWNLDVIVTRDAIGFMNSPIPAISPSEALARLHRDTERQPPDQPPMPTEPTS